MIIKFKQQIGLGHNIKEQQVASLGSNLVSERV